MTAPPVNLLIVDDSKPLQKFLNTYLSANGFNVLLQAYNGQELFLELGQVSATPHICLLDINMPIMDGYETAVKLRSRLPAIKILAYSFLSDPARIEKILKCGADAFICKDVEPREIKEALLQMLNKSVAFPGKN